MTVTVDSPRAGWRLDRFVADAAQISRARARSLVDEGHVTVDGQQGRASARVAEGDLVEIEVVTVDTTLVPEPVEFGIAYQDDEVIVVEKPPGLVVHPGAGNPTGTLLAGLVYRFPELSELGEQRRYGLVHRLDRDTSGVLVVARTKHSFDQLTSALANREVTREYRALIHGHLEAATATVDAPIGRDPHRPTRMAVRADGRPARSHFTRHAEWVDVSLVDISLETGRTHQIRVHAASIGHPVVGDASYGGRRKSSVTTPRTFLHARRLVFEHPGTGDTIDMASPLPDDLAQVLDRLGPPARGDLPGR